MKCKICGSTFVPEKNQKEAWWAVNWCSGDHGLVCPPCHQAAKALNCVSPKELPLGICPFKSDIAEKSKNVSVDDWKKMRHSESWKNWVEQNHPEWLSE